jgi:hypothetical protein
MPDDHDRLTVAKVNRAVDELNRTDTEDLIFVEPWPGAWEQHPEMLEEAKAAYPDAIFVRSGRRAFKRWPSTPRARPDDASGK